MIDTNLIKANSKDISERLKLRNYSFDEDLFANLEAQRKKYQTETEDLQAKSCLLYTSPSPRDVEESRMPSSA